MRVIIDTEHIHAQNFLRNYFFKKVVRASGSTLLIDTFIYNHMAAKKKTVKKAVKKTVKKAVKKAVKKTVKKAAKKTVKKTVKKAAKKRK